MQELRVFGIQAFKHYSLFIAHHKGIDPWARTNITVCDGRKTSESNQARFVSCLTAPARAAVVPRRRVDREGREPLHIRGSGCATIASWAAEVSLGCLRIIMGIASCRNAGSVRGSREGRGANRTW